MSTLDLCHVYLAATSLAFNVGILSTAVCYIIMCQLRLTDLLDENSHCLHFIRAMFIWQPVLAEEVLSVGLQRGVTCVNREGAIRVGNLKRLKHHGNPLLGLSDTCALYWNNCLYESKMFPSQKSTNMMENIAQSGRMLR